MRKQKCISGNARNMSQTILVKLRAAHLRKAKLFEKKTELRSKEKSGVDCRAPPVTVEVLTCKDLWVVGG